MADTFSFQAPPLSPLSHQYSARISDTGSSLAQPRVSSGLSGARFSAENDAVTANGSTSYLREPGAYSGTKAGPGLDGGIPYPSADSHQSGRYARGVSPGSQTPAHSLLSSGGLFGANYQGGVNVRNTRPMTAPSSVSAPYFHGAVYASANPVSSSFYANQAYENHRSFQNQAEHTAHLDGNTRERGFSLPDIPGLPGEGLPDEPKYSNSGSDGHGGGSPSSTFFYAPPAVRMNNGNFHRPRSPDSGPYSRPATGESITSSPHRRNSSGLHPGGQGSNSLFHHGSTTAPYMGGGAASHYSSNVGSPTNYGESKVYNFISSAGATTKRPRRRYDEIERLYNCDYPGCQKAYGTLNHLNSHKTMQKHGPKSTPAQFKDLRKAWREGKKAAAAAAARSRPSTSAGTSDTVSNPSPPSANGRFSERPRPSTSAGEYHYNMPAPFMTPIGTPVPVYAPHLSGGGGGGMGVGLAGSGSGAGAGLGAGVGYGGPTVTPAIPSWPQYQQNGHSLPYDPSAVYGTSFHRPVTAPSQYANTPSFGYHGANHLNSTNDVDRYSNATLGSRRFSLPGTEQLKLPVPTFGFSHGLGVDGGGFSSIQEIQEEGIEGADRRSPMMGHVAQMGDGTGLETEAGRVAR